jgi:hypothetical protein
MTRRRKAQREADNSFLAMVNGAEMSFKFFPCLWQF